MFYSCNKKSTGPSDVTTPTDVSYNKTDLVGTWEGEADDISLELTVNPLGKVSGSGISSQWSIDSQGKVSGGGNYSFLSNSSLIVASASWSLQLNSDKTELSGKLDVSYSGLHNMDVNLTKTGSSFPMEVYITSPSDGSTVSGTVNIRVTVYSSNALSKIEFYINDSLESTDTASPYRYSWDTSQYNDSTYTIKVIAYDTENQTASDQCVVTVNNTLSISITSPSDSSSVSGTVNIYITVNPSNAITKVEFYINGKLKGNDTTEPYTYNWKRDRLRFFHIFIIKVKAYDNDGKTSVNRRIVRKFL